MVGQVKRIASWDSALHYYCLYCTFLQMYSYSYIQITHTVYSVHTAYYSHWQTVCGMASLNTPDLRLSLGMMGRRVWSSTPTRRTSSTCGERKCCRTQKTRGKRGGNRRWEGRGCIRYGSGLYANESWLITYIVTYFMLIVQSFFTQFWLLSRCVWVWMSCFSWREVFSDCV